MIGRRRVTAGPPKEYALLRGLVGILAALHFLLVFQLNINWDEFRYLAVIYDYLRGELASALQTGHIHPFRWLPNVGSHEIDQVIAGRVAYYAFLLGSCGWVYLIARRFFTPTTSLFVVLCYLSYAEVIAHATSFRFDGFSVFLLLGGLALVTRHRHPQHTAAAAAIPMAAAFLVTIKSIFYLPTFALILLARGSQRPGISKMRDLGVFLLSLGIAFGLLYAVHRASLPTEALASSAELLERSAKRVIRFDQPFPARPYILATVALNAVIWLLLLLGAAEVLRRIWKREKLNESLMLLALLLPLGSLIFYRNAFPYFFAFLMPPALVVAGVRFDQLLENLRANVGNPRPMIVAVVVAVLASFAVHYAVRFPDRTEVQRQVVQAVHEIFPDPVPYIDRNSMIASFPKVGFFMSTWGFQNYYERGEPIFEELLESAAPKFLLANHPALILDPTVPTPEVPGEPRLFEEDVQVLRENFIPHWGPIYVAGKELLLNHEQAVSFEILIAGHYTLEATGPILVDGVTRQPGEVLHLAQGHYTARSLVGTQSASLRWGVRLPRPAAPPPTGILYKDL